MLIIPAIDLRGGKCVRLVQGDFARETVYPLNPVEAAVHWERKGAQWLHVVDLDGARDGEFGHWKEMEGILIKTALKVQAGGGVSELWIVEKLLRLGAARVVLSSIVFLRPEVFLEWRRTFGERLLVSLDIQEEWIRVQGWSRRGLKLKSAIDWLRSAGVGTVIMTDIDRDGTMEGIDLSKIRCLVASGFRVIVAGGVGKRSDLETLSGIAGVEGVIVGKALLEGRVDLLQGGKI